MRNVYSKILGTPGCAACTISRLDSIQPQPEQHWTALTASAVVTAMHSYFAIRVPDTSMKT